MISSTSNNNDVPRVSEAVPQISQISWFWHQSVEGSASIECARLRHTIPHTMSNVACLIISCVTCCILYTTYDTVGLLIYAY